MNDKITVRYGAGDLAVPLLILAFFAALSVFTLIFTNMKALSILVLVLLAAYAAAVICPTVLFFLRAEGDSFYSSSRTGRKYDFRLSDIKSITCTERRNYKYGVKYFVEIRTADGSVILHHSMKGFSDLAAFLLEKHSSGELSSSVLSKKCREYLEQYASQSK